MSDPMDTDSPVPIPPQAIEQSLETVLFPPTSTSTPPPIAGRQVSRLSHPPPPIDSPVLSAAQTPSKPSPPVMSMTTTKEGTPNGGGGGGSITTSKQNANTSLGTGHVEGGEKGAGAPVRQYLNEFVTPYLLEGMKMLAKEQPPNPLETLGRYLIQRAEVNAATAALNMESSSGNVEGSAGTPKVVSSGAAAAEVKMEEAL
ncbi:COMPASS (complex proteins associated with Set1p) component [Orbilia ellipsospora]|uniref:COMPASS (Complex proteins associated with Set1p) component n=1 Tax=Orbilia ellipsospora TaxID=2528407 RepID=A0AAV9X1R3_9PEZI